MSKTLNAVGRYNLKADHVPEKKLIVSDNLSKHPIQDENSTTENDVKSYVYSILETLLAYSNRGK